MGLSGKLKKNSNERWGLGLLLVFFLHDDDDDDYNNDHHHHQDFHTGNKKDTIITPSSSSSPLRSTTKTNTSTIYNKKLLIRKAQSTISIFALVFFFTILLFTLSSFEPSINNSSSPQFHLSLSSRRFLPEKTHTHTHNQFSSSSSSSSGFALLGMGTLFRRGTKAMNDLIVAHLTEDITDDELRLFLRTIHRSSITSKSDIVFIFPSFNQNFSSIIHQENLSFLKLIHHYSNKPTTNSTLKLKMINDFDVTQFVKSDKQKGEPIWGKKKQSSNYTGNSEEDEEEDELNELSFGSVVSFESAELDPEDSLSGFFNDPPPIRLRRWACYPMLLGRVRRNFKHIMLVDVKQVVVIGDALSRVRNRNAESVHLWTINNSDKSSHSKKEKSKSINGDVIMGGIRGIRRLSNAMLNEIVRDAIKHKNKNSDSVILSQLIHNESLMKSIEIGVTISESPIQETSEIVKTTRKSSSLKNHKNLVLVHRGGGGGGNRNLDFNLLLKNELCSLSTLNSLVYRDC